MTAQTLTVARDTFARHVRAALGDRVRITKDAEGWPMAPGRLGRLEWRGLERDGSARIYAFTPRRRMIAKLRAVPGVHPQQIGDEEAAFSIMAEDSAALQAVAALLRLRQRRLLTPEQRAAAAERLTKHRGVSGAPTA